jgi:hypothetical protein
MSCNRLQMVTASHVAHEFEVGPLAPFARERLTTLAPHPDTAIGSHPPGLLRALPGLGRC